MRGKLSLFTIIFVVQVAVNYGNTVLAASPTLIARREPELGSLVINSYKVAKCTVQLACSRVSYIELYNKSSSALRLDGWQVNVRYYDAVRNDIAEVVLPIHDTIIRAKSSIVIGDSQDMSFVTEPDVRADFGTIPSNEIRWLTMSYPGQYETVMQRDPIEQNFQYTLNSTSDGYTKRTTPRALVGGGIYSYVDATPLRVREVFSNTTACTPDYVATCREYIKVCNMSDESISLFDYRLVTSASSLKYISLEGTLGGLACLPIFTDIVASGGNAWLEDSEGFISYPDTVVGYPNMSVSRYDGHAWAAGVGAESWQWSLPTPYEYQNVLVDEPQLVAQLDTRKPCLDGQYRSEETGRCRSIALAGDTLQPCKEGQYRSEETNRCRSLVQAVASSLKPCADDQFRNPATGRCKKIASSEDTLGECPEGYSRNPVTNRCRKTQLSEMPKAAFPVVPTEQVADSPTTAIVTGLLITAAGGYALWEWRREFASLWKRLLHRAK